MSLFSTADVRLEHQCYASFDVGSNSRQMMEACGIHYVQTNHQIRTVLRARMTTTRGAHMMISPAADKELRGWLRGRTWNEFPACDCGGGDGCRPEELQSSATCPARTEEGVSRELVDLAA
jgi:hypothetical protein